MKTNHIDDTLFIRWDSKARTLHAVCPYCKRVNHVGPYTEDELKEWADLLWQYICSNCTKRFWIDNKGTTGKSVYDWDEI